MEYLCFTDIQNYSTLTFDSVCGEEGQVLCFQGVFMTVFRCTTLRFRLSSQRRIVHLSNKRLYGTQHNSKYAASVF